MKPKIIVIGSTNTDMIVMVPHLPGPGETVLGGDFTVAQGGKGANQAVAAARAGGDVTFLTCLGEDSLGEKNLNELTREGIDMSAVKKVKDHASGVALINVSKEGENSISVAPGANSRLLPEDIERHERRIAAADIVLLQLEIPLETVKKATEIAGRHEVPVILNPAPGKKLDQALLSAVSVITPNEQEAMLLSGQPSPGNNVSVVANALQRMGCRRVAITMGNKGVFLLDGQREELIPAQQVEVVDTTAAGDTFNGYLAVALARGDEIKCALEWAGKAASLSVTRLGAQPSIPLASEVELLTGMNIRS